MSFDPQGEWGLRFRLRVAIRQGYSYDSLAVVLHVSASVLQAYLSDLAYVLSSGDTNAIIDHMYDVEAPDAWYDRRPLKGGGAITYVESAYWTVEQVEGVMLPDHATAFKIHYLAPSEQHRVMSSPLYPIPEWDWVERVESLTEGDLERLVCIVFYELPPIVEA